jgi:predicted acetyltransferase
MNNKLRLESPGYDHKDSAISFINEFYDFKSHPNGTGGLHRSLDDYNGWLEKLNNFNIKDNIIPADTFFAIRLMDSKIIGIINIRHELNESLIKIGGHIGFSVRPTERNKGYATEILRLGLLHCKKLKIERVLVTCDKSNIASAKTIIKNKGILENEYFDKELSDDIIQRYWIDNK